MRRPLKLFLLFIMSLMVVDCSQSNEILNKKASDILGNSDFLAISYGGYRYITRDIQPTIEQLKEDMRILAALNIRMLRTYNTKLDQAANLLEAIRQLKEADKSFEMYVMLGAWIDCENAWTDKTPNHDVEDLEANSAEMQRAVDMVNQYPDIVKIIAVGNEAMVKWATSYFVQPGVILKWVNHLQDLKKSGALPEDLWITSSDNFASWGGGDSLYHTDDLTKLIQAVDFISMHTYPFHDTHYNPAFWLVPEEEDSLSELEKIDAAMLRAKNYAVSQYQGVESYMKSLGIQKPIHIGETGWSTLSNGFYGDNGSRATDEYKEGLYYEHMRDWTNKSGMSCFYFEAFDEQWKDSANKMGSENHFGLINLKGQVKYALWDQVDSGLLDGLTRDGMPITKTYNGDHEALMLELLAPPSITEKE